VGINFGAPGDRRDADGTLWLDYPSVGGPSPDIPVQIEGDVHYFRRHAMRVTGPDHRWVGASGMEGARSVALRLGTRKEAENPRTYTVRLYFLEPEASVQPSQRVFHVSLQGRRVLESLDLVRETGGTNRLLVKEFDGIEVDELLTLTFTPAGDQEAAGSILCGMEVRAEGW